MVWLGLDFGTKRIGVASGNDFAGIASPLSTVEYTDEDNAVVELQKIAEEYGAGGIVVGWPLNMDDTEGGQGKLTRMFGQKLADATGLDVRMWDERLTSFAADQILAGQLTRKKKKQIHDSIAAATILQDFFSAGGPQGAPKPNDIAWGDED